MTPVLDDMAGDFGSGFFILTLLVTLAGFALALGLTATDLTSIYL